MSDIPAGDYLMLQTAANSCRSIEELLAKQKTKQYQPFLSLMGHLTISGLHGTIMPMPVLIVSEYKVPGCAENCLLVSTYNMLDEPR